MIVTQDNLANSADSQFRQATGRNAIVIQKNEIFLSNAGANNGIVEVDYLFSHDIGQIPAIFVEARRADNNNWFRVPYAEQFATSAVIRYTAEITENTLTIGYTNTSIQPGMSPGTLADAPDWDAYFRFYIYFSNI